MHARQELCALDTKTMEKKGRVMRHQYFMQKNFVHIWAALCSSGERTWTVEQPANDRFTPTITAEHLFFLVILRFIYIEN